MRAPTICLATAAALVLAASGCGGESESSPEEIAAATTAGQIDEATVREIEEICDAWNAKVEGRTFPVEDFDPQNPDPADLPAVGEFFAPAAEAIQTALGDIREISPPAGTAPEVERLADALERFLEVVSRQVAAARAADPEEFTSTLADASAVGAELDAAADALGADSCRAN